MSAGHCNLRKRFSVSGANRRDGGLMEEFVCAENNDDKFSLDDYSVPTDETPDF